MPRKGHSPEQIIRKLREVEVALARGELDYFFGGRSMTSVVT